MIQVDWTEGQRDRVALVLEAGQIEMHDNDVSGDCNNDGADLMANACGISNEDQTRDLPSDFSLSQNFPNPFNPSTTVSYALAQAADVTFTVADVLGREVRELVSGTQPAGTYEVTFDATGLPSGVYCYRLRSGDYVETKRMVVVR